MSMSFGVHVVGWPFSTHKRKEPVSTAWSPSMAKMWSASKPNDSIALYTPSATIWLATSPSIVNFAANFTMNFAMNFAMNFGYQKKTDTKRSSVRALWWSTFQRLQRLRRRCF